MKRKSRKKAEISASVRTITPSMAKNWLAKYNRSNFRNIAPIRTVRYADDMRYNRWMENGETICFDWNGTLVNGQHRLAAIAASGLTQRVVVVRNVDPDCKYTYDTGQPRGFSQCLKAAGEKNNAILSSAIRYVATYKKLGQLKHSKFNPSPLELMDFLDKNPGLRHSTKVVTSHGGSRLLKSGAGAALHYLFSKASSKELADEFFVKFDKQIEMSNGHPIRALRRRLEKERSKESSNLAKLTPVQKAALTVKAWNFWITGQDGRTLIWKQKSEPFPAIQSNTV